MARGGFDDDGYDTLYEADSALTVGEIHERMDEERSKLQVRKKLADFNEQDFVKVTRGTSGEIEWAIK